MDAVPPNEYDIDPHAVHFPLPNMYPALHSVHVADVGPHLEQPGQIVHEAAPAFDQAFASHDLQAEVLPNGEYLPAEHFVHLPLEYP